MIPKETGVSEFTTGMTETMIDPVTGKIIDQKELAGQLLVQAKGAWGVLPILVPAAQSASTTSGGRTPGRIDQLCVEPLRYGACCCGRMQDPSNWPTPVALDCRADGRTCLG
jgi:hypothetical protein